MAATLRTERDGRVMTVRADNPPHNFMNRAMVAELDELTTELEGDGSVGAVVITGAPEDRFITHYDVEEILTGSEAMDMTIGTAVAGATSAAVGAAKRLPGGRAAVSRSPVRGILELHKIHDLFLRWNRMDKVFIAAINGPAMGGGSETALACDLRYMAAESPGMGQPEVLVGFPPGAGGSQRLTRAVGTSRALELILEGRPLSPGEAHELGIVHAVFPATELQARAAEAAERMSRRAPGAIAAAKRAVLEGGSLPLADGLALERKWFLSTVSSPVARRAMREYVDEVDESGSPPFAEPERQRPWLDGTAADLVRQG